MAHGQGTRGGWSRTALERVEDGRLIERFMPESQVSETYELVMRAPADVVLEVAEQFDLMSIRAVYWIFWLRSLLLGAPRPDRHDLRGVVAATKRMGWVELARRPGRELVMGSAVQPWLPEPEFKSIPPDRFLDHAEADHVKIVWTLEAEPMGLEHTLFRIATRVQPTDESARRKFISYWRRAGIGIVLIRRLAGPAIRREAERRAARGRSLEVSEPPLGRRDASGR